MIPPKLYFRMTDMAEDLSIDPLDIKKELDLMDFQESIDWPFSASQEQLDDWNSKNWD